MMQEERYEAIIEYAKKQKFVKVEELTQKMDVSAMTIRRDLNALCEMGQIERCHGGARLPQRLISEVNFDIKKEQNQAEKKRIAMKALGLIKDGDTIYLDSGTTTCELAKLLCEYEKELSVVTNDLNIAMVLVHSKVELTMVGGEIQKNTQSAVGFASEQFLKQYRFSKAFLGGSSVDDEFNLFSPTHSKAYLKKMMLKQSKKTYLMVDSSKFNQQSMCLIGNLEEFTAVITDKQLEGNEKEKADELQLHFIQA